MSSSPAEAPGRNGLSEGEFFFPTTDIAVCRRGDCDVKILVKAYLTNEGHNWELEYTLDDDVSFKDQYDRTWKAAEPIQLRLRRTLSRIEYGMTYEGAYKNAYEVRTGRTSSERCLADRVCCPNDASFFPLIGSESYLAQNQTLYHAFSVGRGSWVYAVEVTATQGTAFESLRLSNLNPSDSMPSLTAQVSSSSLVLSSFADFSPFRLVSSEEESKEKAFVVPLHRFGTDVNRIGITKQSWMNHKRCEASPETSLTAVDGGSRYDQFSKFRGDTVNTLAEGCLLIPELSFTDPSKPSQLKQSFDCENVGSLRVLMELSTSSFRLRALFGRPFITASGVFPIQDGDTQALLCKLNHIDCSNQGDSTGVFEFQPVRCCIELASRLQMDCESVSFARALSRTIDKDETARVIFTIHNEVLLPLQEAFNTKGFCQFDIVQHGLTELTHQVNFSTQVIPIAPPPGSIPISDDESCAPPKRVVQMGGQKYCQPACTPDQNFHEPTQACLPVDCVLKYLGTRNWYDANQGRCVPAAICEDDQVFDELSNECDKNLPPDFESGSTSSAHSNDDNGGISPVPPTKVVDCGPNGRLMANNLSCECNKGWSNEPNQDIFTYVWCTRHGKDLAGFQDPSEDPQPNTTIIGVFIGVVVGCCLLCGVGCGLLWKRKQLRARKKKRKALAAIEQREQDLLSRVAAMLPAGWNVVDIRASDITLKKDAGKGDDSTIKKQKEDDELESGEREKSVEEACVVDSTIENKEEKKKKEKGKERIMINTPSPGVTSLPLTRGRRAPSNGLLRLVVGYEEEEEEEENEEKAEDGNGGKDS
ncbi:hypothetical protein QOT17_001816 [Balamuthia mandrillaris]